MLTNAMGQGQADQIKRTRQRWSAAGEPMSAPQATRTKRHNVAAAHLANYELTLRKQLAARIDELRRMILLDIYLAMGDGREAALMSAVHASTVEVSTAQRDVHEMIADELIRGTNQARAIIKSGR